MQLLSTPQSIEITLRTFFKGAPPGALERHAARNINPPHPNLTHQGPFAETTPPPPPPPDTSPPPAPGSILICSPPPCSNAFSANLVATMRPSWYCRPQHRLAPTSSRNS